MTEDDLYDLLSPLADGRVYPYVMTKPGRYAWTPWLACRCFHLSR